MSDFVVMLKSIESYGINISRVVDLVVAVIGDCA